jgi:L-threonylcarbamoyladenylate synthase
LARLVEAKKRSADKGIALLIDSAAEMERAAAVPDGARRLADRFWPGPLTLVLPIAAAAVLPEILTGGRPTIAFRLPDHDVPRELARRLGPIAASSANVSGQPDATTAEAVIAALGDAVELVLDDGVVRGGVPSTVVAFLTVDAEASIIREGALSVEEIRSAAG